MFYDIIACYGRTENRFNTLAVISTNILARLGKGDYVSMESLHKICKAFNCDVGDICEMKEEK